MKYIEVRILVESSGVEMATAILGSIGIDSIAIKDPQDLKDIIANKEKYSYDYIDEELKPSGWAWEFEDVAAETGEATEEKAEISFFLDDTDEGRAKLAEVEGLEDQMRQAAAIACGQDAAQLAIRHCVVDDEDWKDKWKEFFKPMRITDTITVKPTWEDYTPQEGEKVIEIDPGMAFGTGTHETTSSCIMLMEKYLKSDFKVLDVGCGSGILSIAAAAMGCTDVTGVDLDPDAVEAAKENVKINDACDCVNIFKGDLAEGLDLKADLVVANLTVNLIERLLRDISGHMTDNGIFIASGILTEQEQQAEDAIEARGLEVLETIVKGDWCAIAARRRT